MCCDCFLAFHGISHWEALQWILFLIKLTTVLTQTWQIRRSLRCVLLEVLCNATPSQHEACTVPCYSHWSTSPPSPSHTSHIWNTSSVALDLVLLRSSLSVCLSLSYSLSLSLSLLFNPASRHALTLVKKICTFRLLSLCTQSSNETVIHAFMHTIPYESHWTHTLMQSGEKKSNYRVDFIELWNYITFFFPFSYYWRATYF